MSIRRNQKNITIAPGINSDMRYTHIYRYATKPEHRNACIKYVRTLNGEMTIFNLCIICIPMTLIENRVYNLLRS